MAKRRYEILDELAALKAALPYAERHDDRGPVAAWCRGRIAVLNDALAQTVRAVDITTVEARHLLVGWTTITRRMDPQPSGIGDGCGPLMRVVSATQAHPGDLFEAHYANESTIGLHRAPLGPPGDLLLCREPWLSWDETCAYEDDGGERHVCTSHCRQTYVAYEASPRIGYRPVPDKAKITYLDEPCRPRWRR